MERWRPIHEFFGYSVSDRGRVCNDKTGRIMALGTNQKSVVIVGLVRGGVQYKKTVSHLVAKEYLEDPPTSTFDSIINLDGDRYNNYASNLTWRPRWFALRYHTQFRMRTENGGPIADMETGEEFINSWDAVVKYGLLAQDIIESINNQTYVWPTRQRFWRLD